MTTYEIRLTAKDTEGDTLLIPDIDGLYRATTDTLSKVRETVLRVRDLYMANAGTLGIGEMTASIYEVTFTGERVFIGTI